MSDTSIQIGDRQVGSEHRPYIVAELSANHGGKIEQALDIVSAAAAAGVDAIKLQTYTADTMTIDHHGPGFDIEGGLWHGRSLYDLYEEAHTPWDWHEALFAHGRKLGLEVFSTPFDASAVDFLESFDPPAYKIASFECTDIPLIRKVASTGKPMIISTGIANQQEIGEAVSTAIDGGAGGLCLLHCVSAYPAPSSEYNLKTILDLAESYGVVVGLSDHTLGIEIAIAATALGASLIEKHVTNRRADGGPDSAFSLEPEELRQMVEGCHQAFDALGAPSFVRQDSELGNAQFRRSIYVTADVANGEELTEANIRCIRPGFGLPPKRYPDALGRKAARALKRGEPLDDAAVLWEHGSLLEQ